ncbi:sulfatase-like hydrolase/transferase [Parapusillimonas sp. JC17]|uniref:sulfatase-like hydrolase/transferase n=1 Tax=Parapusillimonas sp. JC17 TaxID=3445768 RepID=UPI003F9FAB5D
MNTLPATLAATLAALTLASCDNSSHVASSDTPSQPPNILFVVLDDFGVDQLALYGYGGATAPQTPNINAIAHAGVRFRNAWSMPTCTPSRATFFQGRYPFRTDVKNAVVALDLANSQVSPFEMTTPKLLKEKGYVNGLVGKMHLSGSDLNPANNPLGNGVMHELGWDYFEGYLDGGPYPIDTTAGGISRLSEGGGVYGCGFIPSTKDDPAHGADSGACYQSDGGCTALSTSTTSTPGRTCLERGGIFDPGQSCRAARPSYIDFSVQNGYYTGEWIINRPDGSVEVIPPSDPRSRGYRTVMETDRAVNWVREQAPNQPWMLSVGYSAIHTPLQQPPESLLPSGSIATSGYTCTGLDEQRVLTNQMTEAMDKEIGRLLVEIGLARFKEDGSLDYQPEKTNTAVVIMADNGTYAPSVKAPFNPTRAKGFPYQTGVWVPLIVAGPMVKQAGREVPHMVNSADMFSLFGELAGLDVRQAVPASHTLDAKPILPYLTEPGHASIRSTNYTEMGTNIASTKVPPAPPCVLPSSNVCVQVFPQQGVCEDQGGIWYGAGGAAGQAGLPSCCAVNDYLVSQGDSAVDILPDSQKAIRDEFFKLVRIERLNCSSGQIESVDEFYEVDQAAPLPKLDNALHNLLTRPAMTPEQQQHYASLKSELQTLMNSHVRCPGDGNLDLVVDNRDIENWKRFSTANGGNSSWYDFNHDGVTDESDLAIIQQNMGKECRAA